MEKKRSTWERQRRQGDNLVMSFWAIFGSKSCMATGSMTGM